MGLGPNLSILQEGVLPAGITPTLGAWTAVTVKGPCILQPVWQPGLGGTLPFNPQFNPRLHYSSSIALVNPALPPDLQPAALRSTDAGVIYFPHAGEWWVNNPNSIIGGMPGVPFVLVAAPSDPAAVPWQTKPRGNNAVVSTASPAALAAADVLVVPWHAFRTDLVVANMVNPTFTIAPGGVLNNGNLGLPVVAGGAPYVSPCPWALHVMRSTTGAPVADQCHILEVFQ